MDTKDSPMNKLKEFLAKYRVIGKDVESNYTNMNPLEKYMIPDGKKFNKFIKLYTKATSVLKYALMAPLSITQKHNIYSYFILDLDFKFPKELGTLRVYNLRHVEKIVKLCNQILLKYLNIKDKHLLAFVMEKKHPHVRKEYSCDGIHIVYPYIGFHTNAHYLIINDIVSEVEEKNMFYGLPHLNSIKTIFDTGVVYKTNWMLYGSCKPDSSPYYLSYILNHKIEKTYFGKNLLKSLPDKSLLDNIEEKYIDTATLTFEHLPTLLNIRKYDEKNITPYVNELTQDIIDEKLNELKNASKKPKQVIQNKNKERKEYKQYLTKKSVYVVTKSKMDDMICAQKLVEIINPERASNYKEWIDIGIALHGVSYSLLDTWIEFSKKCMQKFNPGECERLWEKFDKYGYSLGSLHMWAKSDNLAKYKKYRKKQIKAHILNGLTGTKFDIAMVIHQLYKNDFKCACLEKDDWYHFKNHRWEYIQKGYKLDLLISTEVWDEYAKLVGIYFSNIEKSDEKQKQKLNDKGDQARKVMGQLKDTTHKDKIMKECKKLFYDSTFYKLLDDNKLLLGCKNGVVDLKNHEFRQGFPEDCISLCTNQNYIPYNKDDPKIMWVRAFLKQIQPKKDMRTYVVRLLASCLSGENPHENFHIWTGTGCFAINTLIMMFDGTFKKVQDMKIGDVVMGNDDTYVASSNTRTASACVGTQKKIITIFKNNSELFKITPLTKCGKELPSYTVNNNHQLVLKAHIDAIFTKQHQIEYYIWNNNVPTKKICKTNEKITNYIKKGEEMIITVKNWLKLLSFHSQLSNVFYGYKTPIEMDDCDNLYVYPYLIGVWIIIGCPHKHILKNIKKNKILFNKLLDKKYITDDGLFTKKIHDNMEKLNMFDSTKQKRIPERYLCSSMKVRKNIICGMRDVTNNKLNNRCFSNEDLINDIVRLYTSVGYLTTYIRSDDNLSKWKLLILGTNLMTKLKIRSIGNGNYYGFELGHSDSRFLLHDCTVVSNSNGKSKLITLFQLACGDYCDTLSVSLLTKKRNASNAASPEVAKTKGKRFCVMQEPEEDDKINEGLMKELTGNDEVEARKLFKDPIKFKPQFKIILTCNRKPTINATDGGTWRRIRLVEFKSEFVDEPDPSKSYQFKIDRSLNEKLPEYAEAFLSILVFEYKQYRKYGLNEPKEVKSYTNEYKIRSDILLSFIKDNLCESKKEGAEITLKQLYSTFKSWYKNSYTKHTSLSLIDLQCYLEKHDFKVDNMKLYGYIYSNAIKSIEPNEDE